VKDAGRICWKEYYLRDDILLNKKSGKGLDYVSGREKRGERRVTFQGTSCCKKEMGGEVRRKIGVR